LRRLALGMGIHHGGIGDYIRLYTIRFHFLQNLFGPKSPAFSNLLLAKA
jgi:hypothetical protein